MAHNKNSKNIETETVANEDNPAAHGKEANERTNSSHYNLANFQIWLTSLAIILAIIAILESTLMWPKIDFVLNKNAQERQQLHQDFDSLQNQINMQKKQISSVQQQISTQQQLLNNNSETLKQLAVNTNDSQPLQTFVEINALIRYAQLNLNFNNDINSTLTLLTHAQKTLEQLKDPQTLTLQQALANNINALKALPVVNDSDILVRLNALSLQVITLPLVGQTAPTLNSTAIETTHALSGWHKYWQQSLTILKQLIIVRHQNQPVEPLLTPTQQNNLSINIQIKLNQASWAVLHHNEKVYSLSLEQAAVWAKNYYASNSSATQSFLNELAELQQIKIQSSLPDLAATINLLTPLLNKASSTGEKP